MLIQFRNPKVDRARGFLADFASEKTSTYFTFFAARASSILIFERNDPKCLTDANFLRPCDVLGTFWSTASGKLYSFFGKLRIGD